MTGGSAAAPGTGGGKDPITTLGNPWGGNWPEPVPAQAVPALDALCMGLFLSRAGLAQLTLHFAVSSVRGLLEVDLEGALGMSF